MPQIPGCAYGRIGLLGNPSDGYGGRVIALTYQHQAWVGPDAETAVRPLALRDAAVSAWEAHTGLSYGGPPLAWGTEIPRQAGLSGSSALVIATLRTLSGWAARPLSGLELARLAWCVETEHLGITAGPQDRVVQALEGVLDMDFSSKPWHIERLCATALPPLLLSWPQRPGAPSSGVHGDLRTRWDADVPGVRGAVADFVGLAVEGRARLDAGEPDLRTLFDRSLALRCRIMDVSDDDLAAAEIARSTGAGAKLAGSGGGLVATSPDPDVLSALEDTWARQGRHTLVPRVSRAAGP